nr:15446_t:CDS:2 [Entrophospora candida]
MYNNNIGEIVSNVIGWTYFLAWSISFYPQAILNWKRQRLFMVFNLTFFFSEEIQKEYQDKNGNKDNLVRANDVFFALHALLLSTITLVQSFIYKDFTGGVLSNFQLIFDAYLTNNWSGIKGDFVKFGLGFLSITFDLLFMIQHYLLYQDHEDYNPIIDRTGLLENNDNNVRYV